MRKTLITTVRRAAMLGHPPSMVEIFLYSPWSTTANTAARASGLRNGANIRAVRTIAPRRRIMRKYGLSLSLFIGEYGEYTRETAGGRALSNQSSSTDPRRPPRSRRRYRGKRSSRQWPQQAKVPRY